MIETLSVKDFRCFANVSLQGLTRVNVITGSNASGKSALLEALYLGANASALAVQNITNARGMQVMAAGMPFMGLPIAIQAPGTLSTYFDPLFRSWPVKGKVEAAKRIEIGFSDSENVLYSLGISYQTDGGKAVPVVRGLGGSAQVTPVIFERRKTGRVTEHSNTPITLNQFGQLQQRPTSPFGPTAYIFGADMNYAEADNVAWFSQLKERNEADSVIQFIRQEFPFVRDIEVLAPTGINGLYATLEDGTRRRFTTVSSGIYKIVSILLAAANVENGIIVVDEVENGIFYEKYPALWRVLYQFAQNSGSQIFVSSHSQECLQHLPAIIGQNDADFCLLRTEREQETCTVRHINGTAMKAALQGGNEVRGATIGIEDNNP